MIGGRTSRLLVALLLGGVVVLLRLGQIQVLEHGVWAAEAARLVHSGRVIPYTRGAILDAEGRVLARDVEAYHLVLTYRGFRRGHPVGQVAHARSALELRSVPLEEALRNVVPWALELVELTPAALDAFGRGGELVTPSLRIPASREPGEVLRAQRASDLSFYVRGLLGAEPGEWTRVRERGRKEGAATPFLDLLAGVRETPPGEVRGALVASWAASVEHLAFLAGEIELEPPTDGDPAPDPLALLVSELEESRRAVEGAVASSLFREAAGFPAGRIDPATLREHFDLSPIRVLLRWSDADLADWTRLARRRWIEGWRGGYALPRLLSQLTLDPARPPGPDEALSQLAALFQPGDAFEAALDGEPPSWREFRDLEVFCRLDRLFRADPPRGFDPAREVVLPIQDERLRGRAGPPSERWRLFDLARADGGAGTTHAEDWYGALTGRGARHRERLLELGRELVDGWERLFQARLADALGRIRAAARPRELSPSGALRFARGRLDRAQERSRYILRDFGGRQRLLDADPDYEVVYLLTRFPERYPGFDAVESRRRVRVTLEGDERPLAERLIGIVTAADVRDILRQRRDQRQLRRLERTPERTKDEDDELITLLGTVLLPDEVHGVEGVEGFWDPELRGGNGYRENRGLEDVFGEGGGEVAVVEAVDGMDVRLTLVADVQRAAEGTINHPEAPSGDPRLDHAWFDRPIGAIVLMTIDGDLVAQASAPIADADPRLNIERTLRRPTFQPPGSVFKPFVAAWALGHGLDPFAEVECGPMDDGRAGWGGVRCWRRDGHGRVDLHRALVGSCNSYFAWLGGSLTKDDFRDLAHAFGFGRPSGVRRPPPWDPGLGRRGGLREEHSPELFADDRELGQDLLRRAGNGLARVEATPVQIARAFAGLATGKLPAVRLVAAVGEREVPPPAAEVVAISSASLERIRAALVAVTHDPTGTARALGPRALGTSIAAKTGSADLLSRSARDAGGRVRKHTWVAGWIPERDPVAVFVIFVHDTSATSSHGAVYVARQFLTRPEVQGWLSARGVAFAGDGR